MAWLLLDNLQQFDKLNGLANELLGYPSETTQQYAFPKFHPLTGQPAFPVQGDLQERYRTDAAIQAFVQNTVPDVASRLVEDLPVDWTPDGGD